MQQVPDTQKPLVHALLEPQVVPLPTLGTQIPLLQLSELLAQSPSALHEVLHAVVLHT